MEEIHCIHLSLKNLPFCQRAGNGEASFVKGEEPGKKNIHLQLMGFIFPIQIAGGSQWNDAPFVLSLVMHAYTFVRSNNPWYAMGKQNMQSEKVCFLGSIF